MPPPHFGRPPSEELQSLRPIWGHTARAAPSWPTTPPHLWAPFKRLSRRTTGKPNFSSYTPSAVAYPRNYMGSRSPLSCWGVFSPKHACNSSRLGLRACTLRHMMISASRFSQRVGDTCIGWRGVSLKSCYRREARGSLTLHSKAATKKGISLLASIVSWKSSLRAGALIDMEGGTRRTTRRLSSLGYLRYVVLQTAIVTSSCSSSPPCWLVLFLWIE